MKTFEEHIQTIYPLSKQAVKDFLTICTPLTAKKNSILQPIGATCQTIYYIKKGALRVYYLKGHVDVTENLEFEDAFVARVESLVSGKPSRKGIQAIEDSELIAINVPLLRTLYDKHVDIERLIKNIFLQEFLEIIQRMESFQFNSAEVRYSNFIQDHPDVLKRVQLKYIAFFLGITQVSLSRIRAKQVIYPK